ncbi:hypothetical protein AMS68_003710 [Peltaster fructicola]|uniref:Uncharacterized protein n=1 Tax=Peltaster fructicola TaxID=286661 RepID=A0A6H0XTZ6_9PEZI|nr:hypothetical protein AMS68_003710 [Peltaster fructicola]
MWNRFPDQNTRNPPGWPPSWSDFPDHPHGPPERPSFWIYLAALLSGLPLLLLTVFLPIMLYNLFQVRRHSEHRIVPVTALQILTVACVLYLNAFIPVSLFSDPWKALLYIFGTTWIIVIAFSLVSFLVSYVLTPCINLGSRPQTGIGGRTIAETNAEQDTTSPPDYEALELLRDVDDEEDDAPDDTHDAGHKSKPQPMDV